MSTISAGTSAGTALVSTGDTTGALQLQVNGTTPSVTLAANGAFGVGSTPGYGTSGQVLTSAGSGAAPTWATPSAGALTFISAQTVSSAVASVSFTSGFSSTYDDYLVILEDVVGPLKFAMQVQKSGSFQTSGYIVSRVVGEPGGGVTFAGQINQSRWTFITPNGLANTNRIFGTVYILNVNNATGRTGCIAQVGNLSSTNNSGAMSSFSGQQTTSAVVTGVSFFDEDSQNITAGTFRLYGIQKS